jgi:hypothetical protein
MRFVCAIIASLFAIDPALASNACGDYSGPMGVARVKAKRSFFYEPKERITAAYVVKGDEVITGASDGTLTCSDFYNAKGQETYGELLSSDLEDISKLPLPPSEWLGKWVSGEWQHVTFTKGSKPGLLRMVGDAAWASSEENYKAGNVNVGELDEEAPMENGQFGFTATDGRGYKPYDEKAGDDFKCAARFRLLSSRYLSVEDSGACGGHNVSFSGTYVRQN